MATFDEIFDGAPKAPAPAPKPQAEAAQPDPGPVPAPPPAPEAAAASEPKDATGKTETPAEPKPAKAEGKPDSAMPAQKTPDVVPYASYKAEKQGRKDWKEKAIRLEEQAIRADEQVRYWQRVAQQLQQQPPSSVQSPGQQAQPAVGMGPDPVADPAGYAQFVAQRAELGAIARNVNWSEARARQAHEDFDEVSGVFKQMADNNPRLREQALLHHDPAEFVYQTGKRAKSLIDIGQDPEAWRAAERERLRAEIVAEQAAAPTIPVHPPTPAPAVPPPSLASARSAGPRSGPPYAGPKPFTQIFTDYNQR